MTILHLNKQTNTSTLVRKKIAALFCTIVYLEQTKVKYLIPHAIVSKNTYTHTPCIHEFE